MRKKALAIPKDTEIDWKHFETSLHKNFHVNAVAVDKNGQRKTQTDILWANFLCAFIRQSPAATMEICVKTQLAMFREAKKKQTYVTKECSAGMYRLMVPVVKETQIDGFVSVCGRPFVSCDRIYTDHIGRVLEKEAPEIESLLPSLLPIDHRTVHEIREFITGYA